ncbi:MAG: type II toxin-antitoxin system Phd/YefM family antitoxin [Clostridium sp.]|nr:type II toxin-antitoxin system Phd/YefM family antitoxin [Clostridium sp.]
MTNTNITNFRKNLFEYVNQAIDYNDVININTKSGNVVMMSEEDYNGLMETLYLSAAPGVKEQIVEAANAPDSEFADENEVDW